MPATVTADQRIRGDQTVDGNLTPTGRTAIRRGAPRANTELQPPTGGDRRAGPTTRGNIRGNIQSVHTVHCVQISDVLDVLDAWTDLTPG
jgi:hypothetical protein